MGSNERPGLELRQLGCDFLCGVLKHGVRSVDLFHQCLVVPELLNDRARVISDLRYLMLA